MLCVNNYTREYIDVCRLRVNSQVSAYQKLLTSVRNQMGKNETQLNAAIESFDPLFYNNMVIYFGCFFCSQGQGNRKERR